MSEIFLQRHIVSLWQRKFPIPWLALVLKPSATMFRLFRGDSLGKPQTSLEEILRFLQLLQKGNYVSYPAKV